MTETTIPAGDDVIAEQEPRTLLATWKELLSNIEASRDEPISFQLALRVISNWPKISVQEVEEYFDIYHELLLEMRSVFEGVLAAHPKAIKRVEDDGEVNRDVYIEILTEWQKTALGWELDWEVSSPNAHIVMGAMVDATGFFLGQKGLVAHFDNIGRRFEEADSVALVAELEAWKAAR